MVRKLVAHTKSGSLDKRCRVNKNTKLTIVFAEQKNRSVSKHWDKFIFMDK